MAKKTEPKTSHLRIGDKRASATRIRAELKGRCHQMEPRTCRAIERALANDRCAQLTDIWQRWGKGDFTWVDEILFSFDKVREARQKQEEFLELFRQAIASGVGAWREQVPALYALGDAVRHLKVGIHEGERIKGGNYNAERIFGFHMQDAEEAMREVVNSNQTIPLEVIEGFTPTLQHIINERAKYDRMIAEEDARYLRQAKKGGKR